MEIGDNAMLVLLAVVCIGIMPIFGIVHSCSKDPIEKRIEAIEQMDITPEAKSELVKKALEGAPKPGLLER